MTLIIIMQLVFLLVAQLQFLVQAVRDFSPPPSAPALRALHASTDTQPVDVYINGTKILSNVAFGTSSPFLSVPLGTAALKVTYVGKDEAIISANLELIAKSWYSALAIGSSVTQGNEKLQGLLIADLANTPVTGKGKIRVVHAAVDVPFVDVFAVAPGAKITDSDPVIKNLGFGQSAPASGELALEVPEGSYVLYLAPTGTKVAVYQSPVVVVSSGDDYLISAVRSEDQTDKKIVKLLVVDVFGQSKFLNPQ